MSCNNCAPKKCKPKNCDCPVLLSSDCVNRVTANFECSNIETGLTLTETLEQLDAFICEKFQEINNSIDLQNVGNGVQIYKGLSLTGKRQIRSLVSEGDLLTIILAGQNEIQFSIDEAELTNFVNELITTPCFTSETLTITEEDGCVKIELPTDTDIKRFIVNSSYTGEEETGSLAKPFKTIQGALDAFVGTGTAENPENAGAEIVIQRGSGVYQFTGNFNYNDLTIILEENTTVRSNPSVGDWLVDYDLFSDTQTRTLRIVLRDNSFLRLAKNGFKNRGTTVTGSFSIRKSIFISGTGVVFQETNSTTVSYTILESDFDPFTTGIYRNDDIFTFRISGVTLHSRTQQVYKKGGVGYIEMDNVFLISALPENNVNQNLRAFEHINGTVTINNSRIILGGQSVQIRNDGFTLDMADISIGTILSMNNSVINGAVVNLFRALTSRNPIANINYVATPFLNCTFIGTAGQNKWDSFNPRYCVFSTGTIDPTALPSSFNNIQGFSNNIAGVHTVHLPTFTNRAAALAANLSRGQQFINLNPSVGGDFPGMPQNILDTLTN